MCMSLHDLTSKMWLMGMVFALITLVFGYYFSKYLRWKKQLDTVCSGLAQFPLAEKEYHWFFGNLKAHPGLNAKGLEKSLEYLHANPRYYVFYFGFFRPCLILTHPETVKQLLKTSQPKPTSFGGAYRLLLDWIGYGLLLSSGEYWHIHRKLITPAFHFDILKSYLGIFNLSSDKLVNKLKGQGENGTASVEVFDIICLHTLEIIMKCAFTIDQDIQNQAKGTNSYVEAVLELSTLFVKRVLQPHLHFDFLYYLTPNGRKFRQCADLSHNKAMEVIKERRQHLEKLQGAGELERKKTMDFLDVLLLATDMAGNQLTDQEVRDEVETFMFEGHDTTKSAISFTLYNLAQHPEYQQHAREEVDRLLDGRGSDEITWDDLAEMPYLTKCIKESLRMYPPVHVIIRDVDETMYVDDKPVSQGTTLEISIYGLHHNREVWGDDVFTFDPERFNDNRMTAMDSHAFVPFSAGPRNCIGQNFAMNELKVTIAKILRHFELSVDTSVEFELLPEIVLKTKNGINLFFKPRKK